MNKATPIMDHFIVSKSLFLSVKNLCTIENVDNLSDDVPLSMLLDFSIDHLTKFKFKYKNKLYSLLMLIQLPFTVLHCEDVLCTTHDIVI